LTNIKNIVEALIFSSDRPLSLKQIKDIINDEKVTSGVSVDIKKIEEAVCGLMEQYSGDEYSYRLMEIAGGYRFATKKDYAVWLAKLNKEKLKRKLSQSALETLAIIAYNQPITRSEIEAIRGVNVDYIIGALLEKDLITLKGRAESIGRPMLYGITNTFLEYLGIASINDLPPLKAIEEIIKSSPPEGVSQSDIDFFEEINLIRSKQESGEDEGISLVKPEDMQSEDEYEAEDSDSEEDDNYEGDEHDNTGFSDN
jgi:segregation and condensation protein B